MMITVLIVLFAIGCAAGCAMAIMAAVIRIPARNKGRL